LLSRLDPVVCTVGACGPAGVAEAAWYEEKGYLRCPEVFTAGEVDEYRGWLERRSGQAESGGGAGRVAVTDPMVARLANDPRVIDRVARVLGDHAWLFRAWGYAEAGFAASGGWYWRSDFEAWYAAGEMPTPQAVTVWVPLAEAYPGAGPPMIIPGSHHWFLPCPPTTEHVGTPKAEAIRTLADEEGITQLAGPAGGLALLDVNLLHAAGNNITPYPRVGLGLVFTSPSNHDGNSPGDQPW
jgi:ectoine hydroxylase